MNVKLKCGKPLSPGFTQAEKQMRNAVKKGLREGLKIIKTDAEKNIRSKFRTRTGKGAASVKTEGPKTKGRMIWGAVYSAVYYMWFHIKGARIKPRGKGYKGYLAIPHPSGKMRLKKEVILPKRDWLLPAYEKNIPKVSGEIDKAMKKVMP